MSKSIEQQIEEIFGPGYKVFSGPELEPFKQSDSFAEKDAALMRDLASAEGFNSTPLAKGVATLLSGLTHAQQALVLTEVISNSSRHCEVANVINIKTLQTNLGALLARTAEGAGRDVEPLIAASVGEIRFAAEQLYARG